MKVDNLCNKCGKYPKYPVAGRELKINISNITQAAKGNYKTAGGYKWQYA